jgi:large subunit ribosomal protein L10
MPTEKKIATVAELSDLLSRSTVVIGAEYRGLGVAETTALRRQLREAGIEMHVIKNTLFRRAAEAAGKPDLAAIAEGPTALIVGFNDPVLPIKTVIDYQRTARNTFAPRSAFIDGQIVQGPRLADLATMPSKDTMIGQIAGALQSPIANFAYLLQATLQEFSGLLDARAQQLEGAS